MNKKDSGFTLVELIIVIAIMGILSLIALPNLNGIKNRAQIGSDIRTAEQIGKAMRIWYTDYDAALGDGTVRNIPLDHVVFYADDEFITGKFVGIDYYVGEGYRARSLDVTDRDGTYFVSSFIDASTSVQKVVVGIDQKAAEKDDGFVIAANLTVPLDADAVITGDNWYKDGSRYGWAYMEQ